MKMIVLGKIYSAPVIVYGHKNCMTKKRELSFSVPTIYNGTVFLTRKEAVALRDALSDEIELNWPARK